jgi:N-acetylneuraminic acid mutarotase
MFQQERVSLQIPSPWRIAKLTPLLTLLLFLAGVSPRLGAQTNEWAWVGGSNLPYQPGVYGTLGVPAPGNVPGARAVPATWTDANGNFWLFGGYVNVAANNVPGDLNDLWKYTPSTGEWTWMSGSNTTNQPGVYGTLGVPAPANVPGPRGGAVTWTDASGNLWLYGGSQTEFIPAVSEFGDLWKYTPSTGEWTWMGGSNSVNQPAVYGTLGVAAAGNVPGARIVAVSWMDLSGNFWLFGGQVPDGADLNDLWKYTPSTGEWTWVGGSNSENQPGVYGTLGVPAAGNVPGARDQAVSWKDASGNFWLFGGRENSNYLDLNDLWKYTSSTGEWTWMSGGNSPNQPPVYGTLGVPAAGNVPGGRYLAVSWTDSSGNLWLFGGQDCYTAGGCNQRNDLWEYAPSTGEWTWMSGSNTLNQPAVYGTLGVPAAGNQPGARRAGAAWTDVNGNLWLLAGGYDNANSGMAYLNDFWKYGPTTVSAPSLTTPAPGSTLSGSAATFAWNPGVGATRFVLRLGTTVYGSMDVYHPSPTTGTTAQVSAIPANGAYLYARLWYYLNGTWQYVDARYTEAGTPTPPALTTPAPGSTLPGSTVTFGWAPGNIATRFLLRLGTTGLGSSDVYNGASTTGTSVQVTTVPTNGATLYARLWYYLNETWKCVDATYTEAGQ